MADQVIKTEIKISDSVSKSPNDVTQIETLKSDTKNGINVMTFSKMPTPKRMILNKILDSLKTVLLEDTNFVFYDKCAGYIRSIQQVQREHTNKYQSSSGRNNEKIDTFHKWSSDKGIEFDGLKVGKVSGENYGLIATKAHKKEDIIITVPKTAHICLDQIENAKGYKEVFSDYVPNGETKQLSTSRLAIFLMLEKINENSFWQPYIDILPHQYTTVLFYEDKDFKLLQELCDPCNEYRMSMSCWKRVTLEYIHLYFLIQNNPDDSLIVQQLKEYFTYEFYW